MAHQRSTFSPQLKAQAYQKYLPKWQSNQFLTAKFLVWQSKKSL
jgi:hypothetical protein